MSPRDAILHHGPLATLVQVMACARRHQIIISINVGCHEQSPAPFTWRQQQWKYAWSYHYNTFENYTFKIKATSPRRQCVIYFHLKLWDMTSLSLVRFVQTCILHTYSQIALGLVSSSSRNSQEHYNDVIMGMMASPITSLRIVYSFIQEQIKVNMKAPRHWPLYVEFTGNQWIPLTNRQ